MRTEELIHRLAVGLEPVRRLPPPGLQTLAWLGFALLVIAVAVTLHGLRPDLPERMRRPAELVQFLASLATGIAAAHAAFLLTRPDRASAWALLPLPPLALWLGTLGAGCLAELAAHGPRLDTSWGCLGFITLLSLPLAGGMVWAMRRADRLRPAPVLALGGLAAASLCSAGLSLAHHLDAALMVLVWHGGAVLAVAAAGAIAGAFARG